jgi:hypothetical protein
MEKSIIIKLIREKKKKMEHTNESHKAVIGGTNSPKKGHATKRRPVIRVYLYYLYILIFLIL